MKLYIKYLILFYNLFVYSQEIEITNFTCIDPIETNYSFKTSKNTPSNFYDYSFIAPNTSDENKIIYLNFVFLQNNDGKGNFEEGNPEHDEIIDGIITNLNYRMSHLINDQVDGCINDTGNEANYFLNDTKILFNVKRLYIKR